MNERSKRMVKLALEAFSSKNVKETDTREAIIEKRDEPTCSTNYYENCPSSASEKDFIPSESEYVPSSVSSTSSPIITPITVQESNEEEAVIGVIKKKSYDRKENMRRKVGGMSYITRQGFEKKGKKISRIIKCCKSECFTKISFEFQNDIFLNFYSASTSNDQNHILKSGITISPKKSTKKKKECGKKVTRNTTATYKIYDKESQKKIKVCKNFYMQLFGVTRAKLDVLIKKSQQSATGFTTEDKRGKSDPHNKLTPIQKQHVLDHINSFPSYESHYSRRHTEKKYLQSDLNITKMFELYVESMQEIKKTAISYESYRKLFNKTGYKFKTPKLDTCQKCDAFVLQLKQKNMDEEQKNEIQNQYDKHKEIADDAYKRKALDKDIVKNDNTIRVLVFDLQQCLPTPALSSNVIFYKRLLWVYNLTVRDCSKQETDCYMWHEGTAGRGSNQIASCLYKKILCLPESVKHIITYSDTCGGQNRNINMTAMLMWVMQKQRHLDYIDQKFLVPGHTHLECDADHARIERAKKLAQVKIMVPRDWFNFVRTVRGKVPMNVYEMLTDDFKEFSSLYKQLLTKRKKDTNNDPINWLRIRWIRYTKFFGKIYFKYDLNENSEFKEMNFGKRIIKSKLNAFQIPNTYNTVNFINPQKKADLLSILHLIDTDCHNFYRSLPVKNDANLNYISEEEEID